MIYKIDEWHRYDATGTVVQKVYCLSDLHGVEGLRPHDRVAMNVQDQQHRQLLLQQVEQLVARNALFIVEDPFQVTSDSHPKIAAYVPRHKNVGFAQPDGQKPAFLHFMADSIVALGGELVNVDWRQQAIINHLFYSCYVELFRTKSPQFWSFYSNINTIYGPTLADAANDFKRALGRACEQKVVAGVLTDYYDRVIRTLENTVSFADFLIERPYFYWDTMRFVPSTLQEFLVAAPLVWGQELLDLHALHALQSASVPGSSRDTICMIMGGVHIAAISEQLPRLGYTKVQTRGTDPLTSHEYAQRAELAALLFDVNMLMPTPASWFTDLPKRFKRLFTKNIWANSITLDAEKKRTLDALVMKLAYAKPIDADDFMILRDQSVCMDKNKETQLCNF